MVARPEFATSWWGRAWIDSLETAARLDPSRLSRGRTYARQGAVGALVVEPGRVRARVAGSHGRFYVAEVGVRTIAPERWGEVAGALAKRSAHSAALADGDLDPAIVDDVRAVGVELLAGPGDLRPSCSCPDWAEPCKHAAAVCYLVATELDRDPFLLFLLRGIGRDDLIAMVRDRRGGGAAEAPAAAGVVASDAWAGRSVDETAEDLPALPDGVVRAMASGPHPGRPLPWDARVPADDEVDPRRVDELAADASVRAWGMLANGAPSGLAGGARGDLARRASVLAGRELAALATRVRLSPASLAAWAEAWARGGDVGVDVVAESDTWSIDQERLAAGRDRLVAMGYARRSVALNYDSLGMPKGTRLVIGPDGRWYRLQAKSGPRGTPDQMHLVAPPADDIADVVDLPT